MYHVYYFIQKSLQFTTLLVMTDIYLIYCDCCLILILYNFENLMHKITVASIHNYGVCESNIIYDNNYYTVLTSNNVG